MTNDMSRTRSPRRIWLAVAAAWALVGLAGCASPPRTPDMDKEVRRVAVLSLMEEQNPVQRLGLTIFDANTGHLDQRGQLNPWAITQVEQRLRRARPQWAIVDGRPESAKLGTVRERDDLSERVAAVAQRLGVDQVFVVYDVRYDNWIGQGVGLFIRTISKERLGDASVYAMVRVAVYDRNGKYLLSRGSAETSRFYRVPAVNLGLNYDMSAMDRPEVRAKVQAVLELQLGRVLEESLTSAGYGP